MANEPKRRLNEIDAFEAARLISEGAITAEQVVRACVERILEREPVVQAWVSTDLERALSQAISCDEAAGIGSLRGLPIGVKDVIDTSDFPSGMGSRIYDGHHAKADAACVSLARSAGAIVLGKTVTCEFAGMYRGKTRNPFDPSRTPGGSSSGSAAAVADFMVPFAYGTQTGGSIIRPASFCGIVGFKPTFGTINRAGLKFAAESLDTIGFFARSVRDIGLLLDTHVGPAGASKTATRRMKVGVCRTYLWDEKATDETKLAVSSTAQRLAEGGAEVEPFELPDAMGQISDMRNVIDNVERAHGMAWEAATHWDVISAVLRERIEIGRNTPVQSYIDAKCTLDQLRRDFDLLIGGYDVVLAPAVNGEAPEGIEFTGDPSFQSIWTALHVPAITLPAVRGPNGLPVGIQLVSGRWRDRDLLAAAQQVSDALAWK